MTRRPVLYHMPQTRGGTTLWMNEELGDVCEVKIVNVKKGEGRAQSYLDINPMGKIPALVDDNVIVTEAAAICAYLADRFPAKGLAPQTDDPRRGVYYRWMFFAPSVIEPMMLDKLGGLKRENAAVAGHGDPPRVLATIDKALERGPWLLGDQFSAADVVFGSALFFATLFGAIEKEGRIRDYVERVAARPAHQSMMRKNAEQMASIGR